MRERVSEWCNDDDARGGTVALAAGEVGPLNQYGGGVSRYAAGGWSGARVCCIYIYSAVVRAGQHPCSGAGVGVRAAVEQLLAGMQCTIRPEISGNVRTGETTKTTERPRARRRRILTHIAPCRRRRRCYVRVTRVLSSAFHPDIILLHFL